MPFARITMFVVLLALTARVGAVSGDTEQPTNILADGCVYDHTRQESVCRGTVEVQQGTLQVYAEVLRVRYQDKKVVQMTAEGQPARYSQQLETGKGQVHADARTIVYHTAEERVEFLGNANLSQEGNDVHGEVIHYDMVAGRVTAKPETNGRVSVTLQPPQSNP